MKIHIANNDQLIAQYEEHGIKLAAKVNKLIIAILERSNSKGEEDATIRINAKLVPMSYSTVPAMFARMIAPHVSYLSVQCFLKGEDLEIYAADVKHPATFRARAIHALLTNRRFVCRRARVPKTYRQRPNLFARFIANDVDGHIATIAKQTKIIWKLTTKHK